MVPIWSLPPSMLLLQPIISRLPEWATWATSWVLFLPVFFWAFFRAWRPVMDGQLPLRHGMCLLFGGFGVTLATMVLIGAALPQLLAH
jgi:hypothetical protein